MTNEDCQGCPGVTLMTWKNGDNGWQKSQAILANVDVADAKNPYGLLSTDFDVSIMVAQADKVRECSRCREYFTTVFTIPELWWSDYCRNSNGYFGCEDTVDEQGNFTGLTSDTWFRVLIKQTLEFTKNEDEIHYMWYKLNVFTRWIQSTKQTIIIIFDPPPPVTERLPCTLLHELDVKSFGDPYWIYPPLVEEIVRLQDKAVWAIRNLVRRTEETRAWKKNPKPNYPRLHEIARHAVHVSETLDLAVKTVDSVLTQHEQLVAYIPGTDKKTEAVSKRIHQRLLFYEHILSSLRSRSASNKERLLNEIELAFNTVAQYDSRISVEIGRAAQSDSAAMKTIAFLTLTFLPATFTSAIFSMSFFNYNPGSGSWSVSNKFWIYWTVAIPVTILTSTIWYFWNKLFPPLLIGGEQEQPRNRKRLDWMKEVAIKLREKVGDGDVSKEV